MLGAGAIFRDYSFIGIPLSEGMVCNQEERSTGEHESGELSPYMDVPAGLSGVLNVLSHRNNRRILFQLLKQDKPISVDALTARVASDRSPLATAGTVRAEGRNKEVSR